MNYVAIANIVLLISALSITGCSSAPEAKKDQGNSAQSQKSNAKQAQDELSRDTSRKK